METNKTEGPLAESAAEIQFGENGDRQAASSDWLAWFCREHAMSQATALEVLADVANHWSDRETDAINLRAEVRLVKDLIERGFVQLQNYEKQNGDRRMAERCLWLLLDFPVLAGAESLADLVKLLGRKKQTVNKCLQFFQSQIPELPILPGQRAAEAKDNMSAVQKKIWHRSGFRQKAGD